MIPKSSRTKIAFTGTNSSGKTTMAMEVCARLKRDHHVLAELVSSQDRKITWSDAHFPVDPRAHFGMVTNMIHAEVQAELKGDANVVITDRSVLDLYAIALTDHPDSTMILSLGVAVLAWVKTYTKIFYLAPLPYQEDGKRPSDEFRMRTHATLLTLLDNGQYPNVERYVGRHDVFKAVKTAVGIVDDNPVYGEKEKWLELAKTYQLILTVKTPKSSTSDRDVWFRMAKEVPGEHALLRAHDIKQAVASSAQLLFGSHLAIDLMYAPEVANVPFQHTTYYA